jgi:hypothetical protein
MAIDSVSGNAAPQIAGVIQQAAQSTGTSFEYLLTTARIESNLNPAAQAPTSSAKGLYQFIDQTWLGTMKQAGPSLGLGRFADAISRSPDGQYSVPDPDMRSAILRMRNDPTASALLAGAFTRNNAAQLSASIGRSPTDGELYIAHFLGSDGAGRLITAAARDPGTNAAVLFPAAAAANPSIFYDRSGSPRSADQVYAKLTGRFETARAMAFAPGLRGTLGNGVAASPDTAGITQAFADANNGAPPLPDTRPLFQAMFSDRVRAAVSPQVSSLWAPPADNDPAQATDPARPLDLFTTQPTGVRKLFGA